MKKLIIRLLARLSSYLTSKAKLKKSFGSFIEPGSGEYSTSLCIKFFDENNKFQDPRWWEGQRIDIERAAEPTNVYWENMAITFSNRFKRTLITYFIAFICLGVVFCINLGLNISRDLLQKTAQNSSGISAKDYIIIMLIGICSSLVVTVNNVILTKIIRVISKYERHETYTKYNVSVAIKLTFSMFTNTGIIPLIINLGNTNWFGYGGLVVDIFLIMVTVNLVTPMTHLFDVEIFLK
jgi:Calcium-activated chloride channel